MAKLLINNQATILVKRLMFGDSEQQENAKRQKSSTGVFVLSEDDVACDLYSYNSDIEKTMSFQSYGNSKGGSFKTMRSILVDWLVSVHFAHGFSANSLFLAVSILDRYCAAGETPCRKTLQLYGIASLLLATKYHERNPLRPRDCATYTAGCYTVEQILVAESEILSAIGFRLSVPTVHTFVHIFLSSLKVNQEIRNSTEYIAEKCLYEMELVAFPPSLVAFSAMLIALSCNLHGRQILQQAWGCLHARVNYTEDDSTACKAVIKKQLKATIFTRSKRKLEAVDQKYTTVAKMDLAL
mmetsp:Transcript_25456/g.38300  ORF Transcript_25456/g.38300 Transcript_25456/m.38300 type:complete len:298 (-) Transcript_25456:361-1254(-)